jgi:methionyl-tRNA formyltransferase
MRIVFAGTPEFALPPLRALIESNHEVVAVLSQPDRPAGRGQKLQASAVKRLAIDNSLTVITPENLREDNGDNIISLLSDQIDVMVVVAYGLIIPERILSVPRYGCINIHPSKLPLWRGAAPIQYSILSGDAQTAMSIIQMDKGMDTGDILYQHDTDIGNGETAAELHERMAALGAECLLKTLELVSTGQLQPQAQDHTRATYSQKITKQDALIDWQLSATDILLRVRAFNAWPVAYTHLGEMRLRIWQAEVLDQATDSQPGTVIAFSTLGLDVATGEGVLRITACQRPGSKVLPIKDFYHSAQSDWAVGESILQ